MPYRDSAYLRLMSQQLGASINAILVWARGNANQGTVWAQARARLHAVLTRYYRLLVAYTVRTRIQPIIGHPLPLTAEDEISLQSLITQKLEEFDDLLTDTLRSD